LRGFFHVVAVKCLGDFDKVFRFRLVAVKSIGYARDRSDNSRNRSDNDRGRGKILCLYALDCYSNGKPNNGEISQNRRAKREFGELNPFHCVLLSALGIIQTYPTRSAFQLAPPCRAYSVRLLDNGVNFAFLHRSFDGVIRSRSVPIIQNVSCNLDRAGCE
jgi:hypothetical protein